MHSCTVYQFTATLNFPQPLIIVVNKQMTPDWGLTARGINN